MYSELSDEDKEMYLDVLREAPLRPFSNFVSRGDIPDKVDISRPRSYIDREVYRLVRQTHRDKASRLIPILGSAGSGKKIGAAGHRRYLGGAPRDGHRDS